MAADSSGTPQVNSVAPEATLQSSMMRMVTGIGRLEQLRDEIDALNIEEKIKDIVSEIMAVFKAIGRSMEVELLRMTVGSCRACHM